MQRNVHTYNTCLKYTYMYAEDGDLKQRHIE